MNIRYLIFAIIFNLFIFSLSAYALNLKNHPSIETLKTQRNCPLGGDLDITKNTSSVFSQCVWLPNDDLNMQITLHVSKDIDFIAGHCLFMPNSPQSYDSVEFVMGSKSGNNIGSAAPVPIQSNFLIIEKNKINFILRNFNNTFDDDEKSISHLNVLFYLNNEKYTPGDQITCTFVPVIVS